jgi:hypothetical protein
VYRAKYKNGEKQQQLCCDKTELKGGEDDETRTRNPQRDSQKNVTFSPKSSRFIHLTINGLQQTQASCSTLQLYAFQCLFFT